jgi:hypothetical protein
MKKHLATRFVVRTAHKAILVFAATALCLTCISRGGAERQEKEAG